MPTNEIAWSLSGFKLISKAAETDNKPTHSNNNWTRNQKHRTTKNNFTKNNRQIKLFLLSA